MSESQTPEQKHSVYIALGISGALAAIDLVINNSIEASKEVVLAFLAFAGLRQVVKSFLKK